MISFQNQNCITLNSVIVFWGENHEKNILQRTSCHSAVLRKTVRSSYYERSSGRVLLPEDRGRGGLVILIHRGGTGGPRTPPNLRYEQQSFIICENWHCKMRPSTSLVLHIFHRVWGNFLSVSLHKIINNLNWICIGRNVHTMYDFHNLLTLWNSEQMGY